MTKLPLPLTAELPNDSWQPVDPATVGVSNAAMVAQRSGVQGYIPSIVLSGDLRTDDATLPEIADEALAIVRRDAPGAEVVNREETSADRMSGVTQLIAAAAVINGQHLDMRILQAITAYQDDLDPTRRGVIIHTLTCTDDQLAHAAGEFQTYLRSVTVLPQDVNGPR